jgi:hypothetical protein
MQVWVSSLIFISCEKIEVQHEKSIKRKTADEILFQFFIVLTP